MVEINGATLYYEIRGSGPSLLFIPGAEGDAEEYLRVAELLENEYTVISYDRRAFSRSPRPPDFDGTSVDEQADDAAALVHALGLAPAVVWGNSSGGIIALGLVLRHPEVVRMAMLHEAPLYAGLEDPDCVHASLRRVAAQGKVAFLRMLLGDDMYEGLSDGYRRRLETDTTWIQHEFESFQWYRPSDEALADVKRPVAVLVGANCFSRFVDEANWIASHLGTDVLTIPGAHGVHYDRPEEVARVIRVLAGSDSTPSAGGQRKQSLGNVRRGNGLRRDDLTER